MIKVISFFILLWQKTRILRDIISYPKCRFYPSCSEYSLQAFNKLGIIKGFSFSIRRFLKCHPLNPGGIDFIHGS